MKNKFLQKEKLLLKTIILNKFMKNGQKRTSEKFLLQAVKLLQKKYVKNSVELFKSSLINTSPVFLMHTRVLKKGKKRRLKREFPAFLSSYSSRVKNSISFIKKSIIMERKTSQFYRIFSKEIVKSSSIDSISIAKKVDVQNQVLSTRRYWVNFKW